jgi:hypothetical protein
MTTKTTKTTRTPKAQAKAKPSRRSKTPAATATTTSAEPRVTKEQMVIQALCRPEGATVEEMMELTGWQAHSVRGFLSGTAKKKLGLTVERITEDGRTVYRVPSVAAGGRFLRASEAAR